MKRNTLLFFMTMALVFASCSYDSEDDLVVPVDSGVPDDSELITYEADIKSIMQGSCIGCHASPPRNGAPFSLVNFSQVSTRSSTILNAMSRQSGSASAMPPSGRLPQTTIDLIDKWIEDGLKEN